MSDDLLRQFEAAQSRLSAAEARVDNDSSNNPDKHRAEVEHARAAVVSLRRLCQAEGVLPMTGKERLKADLDRLFPQAGPKTVVAHEGAFYRKHWYVVARSKSGNPQAWDWYWDSLPSDHEAVLALLKPAPTEAEKARLAALRAAWPFKIPAGGLVLELKEGAPAVAVSAKKVAVGYRKGYPDLRTGITVALAATPEAIEALVEGRTCPSPSDKPAIYLGRTDAGERAWLRKRGAGHQGLFIETAA